MFFLEQASEVRTHLILSNLLAPLIVSRKKTRIIPLAKEERRTETGEVGGCILSWEEDSLVKCSFQAQFTDSFITQREEQVKETGKCFKEGSEEVWAPSGLYDENSTSLDAEIDFAEYGE